MIIALIVFGLLLLTLALADEGSDPAPSSPSRAHAAHQAPAGLGPDGCRPANAEKPWAFEELADHLTRAIRFAYDLKRKNTRRNIPWRGPEIGENERACSPGARERLRASRLAYAEEDQGRDALDEIMGLAVQLGIEQGRRIVANSPEAKTDRMVRDTIRLGLERLGGMEAFELPRVIDPERDAELLARIDYARKLAEFLK